jgi:TetR/AcrR family fatty acid metabolism transcriptional regulator
MPADTHTNREPSAVRAEKRAILLDAAIQVFARNGYHGSRVSDIATEAGVAYGLVYHYFKNKEEILATIFEERWAGFLDALEGIAGGTNSTEDKLVSVAALILNVFRVRPDWVKVLVMEIQRSQRFSEPEQIQAVGRLFELVGRIVRAGQTSGELRDDLDAQVACTMFIGALDLEITSLVLGLKKIDGNEAEEREHYSKVAQTVVGIFMRGMESRS